MSMHNFSGTGPNMAALAAYIPIDAAKPASATFEPSTDDLVRMIENVADQISEVAAQLVDMRRRINTLEANSLPRSLGDMEPAGEKVIRKQARGWTGLLHGTFNGA